MYPEEVHLIGKGALEVSGFPPSDSWLNMRILECPLPLPLPQL
jgi:hypothetical protein